jgi:hypothetical protein
VEWTACGASCGVSRADGGGHRLRSDSDTTAEGGAAAHRGPTASRGSDVATEQEALQQEPPVPEAFVPPAAPRVPVRGQAVQSPTAVPSAEQWKRAAQGLRDGDFERADAALKELRRRGTEAERESALLVQAQVLLAQGRDREAQSLLKSLEVSARAPSVRRKSVELLARFRDRPAARSDRARVVTEAP